LVHILLLHKDGSNNPLGIDSSTDKLTLYPYFVVKDIFAVILMIMFLSALVYFTPDALGHPDNYVPANPLVTPAHIVPE
jgi:ubiquinol-cytochrome c reductase cytochrome b subunit